MKALQAALIQVRAEGKYCLHALKAASWEGPMFDKHSIVIRKFVAGYHAHLRHL